jgi:GDPmannose 4,6-dehydratase
MKTALITGISGQDGNYLAKLLLEKGYQVHGLTRWVSQGSKERRERLVEAIGGEVSLHQGDLTDMASLAQVVQKVQPDEIYNLGALTHVPASYDMPLYTADVDAIGTLRLLEVIRMLGLKDRTRFYQASTSEMFGQVRETPQRETTPFQPRSPYAAAKVYAHWMTVNAREAYGLHASNGILFNHESPHRDEAFVTRKITRAAARIKLGQQEALSLGNLSAERDWGHARDYVEAMWLMLQQDSPDDYVVSSGETHTVREFTELAFREVGLNLAWEGEGTQERGIDPKTGRILVNVDPRFYRPVEDDTRKGDSSKARKKLGWAPRTSFSELIREMVHYDLADLGRQRQTLIKG